ncbi:pbsp domain-containing protein [Colletotrichum truncatum]|uniref:Pbsp domain-containing protein n=1 Tax=Colletotrichum truncatum TaxID=5467 RepID=A0ACC3YMK4_COLTU|nr:pbsp domain-containing protein [Colletotrichum truncatum]KAF6792233.1 pbsp domain-containing protein [Colletotrichum truncatum]
MVLPPHTTPAPKPGSLFLPAMSSTEPSSTQAPPPGPPAATPLPRPKASEQKATDPGVPAAAAAVDHRPPADPKFDLPKLRLEIRDLNHPAAAHFLSAVNASTAQATAVHSVLNLLYESPSCPTTHVPPTRSVTLILRDMPGVAYTTGSDLDDDHKEIHFSMSYIAGISAERRTHEIMGVLTHEMVHCFQWNARGTCPGGLIEGIADWVRLNSHLSPPHWKREASGKWDGGYQHTAYFLDYLEGRFGEGTVRKLNEKLRNHRYQEKEFWTESLGRPVEQLWKDYREKLKDDEAVIVNKDDISDDDVRLGLMRAADETAE